MQRYFWKSHANLIYNLSKSQLFCKIFAEKFGGLKNNAYLCHRLEVVLRANIMELSCGKTPLTIRNPLHWSTTFAGDFHIPKFDQQHFRLCAFKEALLIKLSSSKVGYAENWWWTLPVEETRPWNYWKRQQQVKRQSLVEVKSVQSSWG